MRAGNMSIAIVNMISKIRNACMSGKDFVEIPTSKYTVSVLKIMKNDGYIIDYEINEGITKIELKYHNGQSVIRFVKAISTPRKPVYSTLQEIEKLGKRFSTTIISTNRGVLAHQEVIANKIGGKLICEVSA